MLLLHTTTMLLIVHLIHSVASAACPRVNVSCERLCSICILALNGYIFIPEGRVHSYCSSRVRAMTAMRLSELCIFAKCSWWFSLGTQLGVRIRSTQV